jgi:hypothetical protein
MEKAKLEAEKQLETPAENGVEKNNKCFDKRGILSTMLKRFLKK